MKANVEADWETIDHFSMAFEHILFSNIFLTQLIRAIFRFDSSRLIAASQHIQQVLTAVQIAEALELEDRFVLGAMTTSPWVRFACVYATFLHRRRNESFSSRETQLLTSLLIKVAADRPEWHKWMMVFNRYPIRYPGLQEALGNALAKVAESAIQTYVASINLYDGHQEGRNVVASCLSQFRCAATLERRQYLWSMAYQRWMEWDFDATDTDRLLSEICWSELDYGVVGYVMECLDQPGRDAIEKEITDKLITVDNDWHASFSDCVSSWNRLLSRLQPFAHASYVIKAGKDWLAVNHYTLEALRTDRYLKMMYSIR